MGDLEKALSKDRPRREQEGKVCDSIRLPTGRLVIEVPFEGAEVGLPIYFVEPGN